ncbi:hypothetical protein BAE44_0011560 [Dichanthelium oligosanthes]|uniref:C2H2-type domain-containing protein n=1 Tax=Dichanthelium oligosanthes TaxID=888268 RepID=A0A1E5VQL0_9POAL|nr:hypothetical protein BAE44_0011560 [Dichanthelium oligosanthes]
MTIGAKKKSSQSSWMAMGFHRSSSSGKDRAAVAAAAAVTEGKNGDTDKSSGSSSKKKRSVSISRSMTCAGSICSTKESSVLTRNRDRGAARSASSRSLRAPDVDDVVDAVYAAAAISATSSFNSEATAATSLATTVTSASSPLSSALSSPMSSSFGSSFRGVQQIRKLSGCYECHSVFDPRSLGGAAAFPCADCDEVFVKAESLELHRANRHAVSELGPDDTSRNIVEIIFQSSWLRKQAPVCKIDRILKVQSSDRTVKRFEQYKESIKERASSDEGNKKNPRCVADGNELLRFHCTTFTCSLGAGGGTALCRAPSAQCKLCSIIRDGFRVDADGKIATMATSGRAHDTAQVLSVGEKKAMLVCRVVAGRVTKTSDRKSSERDCDCDSVSPSSEGVYSDLDELFLFNPRAILPCFVVIYSGY